MTRVLDSTTAAPDSMDAARRDALLRFALEMDPSLCRRVRALLNDLRDPERAKTILGALISEAQAICQEGGWAHD